MLKLHLGVYDVPYNQVAKAQPRLSKSGKLKNPRRNVKVGYTKTTSEVAKALEDEYGVMEVFVENHGDEIAEDFAKLLMGDLEIKGKSNSRKRSLEGYEPFLQDVQARFQKFLDDKEMDGIVEGVPTGASIKGINHRLKDNKGIPGRPSFVDTGLYRAAFKAWITK